MLEISLIRSLNSSLFFNVTKTIEFEDGHSDNNKTKKTSLSCKN